MEVLHTRDRRLTFGVMAVSIAALHSITSSAVASSEGGTVRPSALAVLRLIANSYLVGLHRQLGRLLALEDEIHVARRATVLLEEIRPIGDQTRRWR